MDLEIIERGESREGHPSLLFVHGYWQAAWTWDEHVMPALARLGHHCVALSLRGHGESEGKIRGASISDYVSDIEEVVATLDPAPILLAHSMGGFTAQHYLAKGNQAHAVVLVSPVPRKGAWGATFRVIAKHPWRFLKANLTLDVGAVVETSEAAYDFLLSPHDDPSAIDRYMGRLERASYRVYLDLLLNRPDLSAVELPALVVGGTEDGFFREREWRDTARLLNARVVMLEDLGHQPMWEGDGRLLVDTIDQFVSGLSPS